MAESHPEDLKFLSHYGVKGMKWGVRRKRDSSGSNKKSKTDRTPEQKAKRSRRIKTALLVGASIALTINEINHNTKVAKARKARNTAIGQNWLKQAENLGKTDSSHFLNYSMRSVAESGRNRGFVVDSRGTASAVSSTIRKASPGSTFKVGASGVASRVGR